MTTQQLQARYLYFNENKTQKQIAGIVGVTERTLYNWIRQYSWHQQREAANSTMAIIADNIGDQLLGFQRTIAGRNEDDQCITPQKVALQNKLISGLIRMKKYPRKGQITEYMENFLHFADEQDKTIGDALFDIYERYIGAKDETAGNRKEKMIEEPENSEPNVAETLAGNGSEPFSDALPVPEKSGNETAVSTPGILPVTPKDFETYKSFIGTYHLRDMYKNRCFNFNNRAEDKLWVEYNLFQYCLPPAERKFIFGLKEMLDTVDIKKLYARIDEYLSQNTYPKMAA